MRTVLLSRDQIVDHWHLVKDSLKAALDHGVGESKLADYLMHALELKAQIWVILDDNDVIVCSAITQFIDYSSQRSLHIVGIGGTGLKNWSDQYYVVEQFAKDNKCSRVEMWGRKGWERVLPKIVPGFKPVYTVMSKELRSNDDSKQSTQ
jgi:hypothetical protein